MGATQELAPDSGTQAPAPGQASALGQSPAAVQSPAQVQPTAPGQPPAPLRRTARVGVAPARAFGLRPRLLAALEAAYPVRFEAYEAADPSELDAVLVFGGPASEASSTGLIELREGARPGGRETVPMGLPVLQAIGEERGCGGGDGTVVLGSSPELAKPLRGARLSDAWSDPLPDAARSEGQSVLAHLGEEPAWVFDPGAHRGAPRQIVSVAPAELEQGESLRERLAPGRCLAMLVLANFLGRLTAESPGRAPVLEAAFVLDDPNLHWPTYGHLRYGEVARHAQEHGYHMSIAMSPLDAWFAHPRAVQIFREHRSELSLCIHGNDHFGGELGRVATDRQGYVLARQALARAAAFEGRTGIAYERVMVPPHEQLSEPAARGLRAAGFEAVCVSRAYPWIRPTRPGPAAALGAGPSERGASVGWSSREMLVGGLPSLSRTGFNAPAEDLVLRAFLGQPLIVYAHQDLLRDGLGVLTAAVTDIEALGDVRWASLANIARHDNPQNPKPDLPDPSAAPRPALRPLLRRCASELRDRVRIG